MWVRFYTGAIKDRLCITDFNEKQNLAERKVKKHIKSIIPRHRKYMLLPGICFNRYRFLGDLFIYLFFVSRCTPARHDALLTCTCETPMHFWIKIQSIQIYISARRVSVSWHSLLEDVVTIKANGATATEDVVICVNAHSLLLWKWNIGVTKQTCSFKQFSANKNQLSHAKFS